MVGNVGRIRDDQIEPLVRSEGREEVPLTKLETVGDAMSLCILPRQRQRFRADVGCHDPDLGFVPGDGDGDCATAGADVGDVEALWGWRFSFGVPSAALRG